MTEQTTVISVRGDARLEIAPDVAFLYGSVEVEGTSRAEALGVAATALEAVIDDFRALGGAAARPAERIALSWTARSASCHEVRTHDKNTGESRSTGRFRSGVALRLSVRDFALLDRLQTVFGAHQAFDVGMVNWSVDHDNPVWREVRAAAITAALQRGRDYATALGGTLVSLASVADDGLLGGDGSSGVLQRVRASADWSGPGGPSLDPEPQVVEAVIEARFVAVVAALA